ncbi:DNA internalization-related competence protein ComEC/Rec2 [Lentibacillus kapialis]|uniref:DNA internalization-related competence protein ComEC/Rec2 n=1 Tax=Lentibacillus kapialis TaxID=340214 RepID=A0A917UT66_9BACI|nr:DNA internalization-related competence protein ComEC/Rec2 [Lentibacillus kapialis]GGJ83556.1 DNA internalization-related competence protein ComEC/Rec2 [Lentibacillus kapialis]
MKGYWHFPALGIASSFLAILFESKWFLVLFFSWILLLSYHQRLGKITVFSSLAISIFTYTYIPELERPLEDGNNESVNSVFTGRISSPINESESRIAFEFNDQASGDKYLMVYFTNGESDHHNLKYGASCTIYGKPELPEAARNPGQFDYQKYLLQQGITYQVIIGSLEDLECSGSSFLNNIYQLRSDFIQFIRNEISPSTAAWLNALVLGDDTQISDSTTELFRRWNLSHVLAISGLHVGLLVGLLYFLLVKMTILTKEKAQWVVISLLPLYAVIAGGEPSVIRASAMVVLFMVANKMNWKFSVTDVLSIVFITLILWDPYILYHIGFQLSFAVTLGLLLSKKWLAQSNGWFFTILKISFVSQMIILPLQVEYFFTFQPLSILLNLVVVPYFTMFVIPLMFLMLLTAPLSGFLILCIDWLFIHIHDLFMMVIQAIDQTLYFPWVIGSFPLAGSLVYYALLLIFLGKMETERQNHAFLYGIYLTLLLTILVVRPYFSPTGTVAMLDIGQGEAIVLELPYRQGVILIDAGAEMSFEHNAISDEVFKQIIRPYLYSRGISKVDAAFISHEDIDHMGSLQYIIKSKMLNAVIVSEYYTFSDQLNAELMDSSTAIIRTSPNESLTIGDHTFHVLAPGRDKASTNENSLVLYTTMGGKKWLFTGDIGSETERDLIEEYPALQADVLKVAHHGSNNSTDQQFLKRIQPAYGLISAGKNNMYGHPHKRVLDKLAQENVHVIRTDHNGAIRYYFNETEGTFQTYLP